MCRFFICCNAGDQYLYCIMSRHLLQFCFSIFFFIVVTVAKGQIVNVESARMQSDTTGWMGSFGAGLSFSRDKQSVLGIDLDSHLQYKTKKDLWLILGHYGFLEGGREKFIYNSLGHIRYNTKLNDWLRWEAFAQMQNNLLTQIQSRFLLGTGPRFKIVSTEKFHFYAASLIMYERETEKTKPPVRHFDWRNSSYVSFTIIPSKTVEIITTTYFQPLIKFFADWRILNQLVINVKASKHFEMSVRWNYLHDRYPAGTAPKTTYSFDTGGKFNL